MANMPLWLHFMVFHTKVGRWGESTNNTCWWTWMMPKYETPWAHIAPTHSFHHGSTKWVSEGGLMQLLTLAPWFPNDKSQHTPLPIITPTTATRLVVFFLRQSFWLGAINFIMMVRLEFACLKLPAAKWGYGKLNMYMCHVLFQLFGHASAGWD